jgi:hypothetical protein
MADNRESYVNNLNRFFNDIRKCPTPTPPCTCHNGSCKYIGTLDERLQKYREMKEKEYYLLRKNIIS